MEKDFFNSKHCSSRKHCQACRSVKSNNFRKSVSGFYNIEKVDFECPYGVNWGFQKAQKKVEEKVEEKVDLKDAKKQSVLKKIQEQKIEQEKLLKKNTLSIGQRVRKGELDMLDYNYIMKHLRIFRNINGFDDKFKECDLLMKEALATKKGCTSCTRGKINRKLVNFVIPKVGEVIDILPDNLVIPGKKTIISKDLKK